MIDTVKLNPWDLRALPLTSPQLRRMRHVALAVCLELLRRNPLGATSPFPQHRAARRQTLPRHIRQRCDAGWGLWPGCECQASQDMQPRQRAIQTIKAVPDVALGLVPPADQGSI
ncbi:hypothetical protein [Ralstonia pseudosolanacearum]|nr:MULTISPECIES: hypothetical protein [Ralstonia]QWQ14509.1 hypothetical protein KN198_19020 [Ralstonia solanacearum]MBX9430721.1 hypothetical protein [Ralstonia pseudosolanacearum]UZF16878.1 hypothetical protein LH706_23095 [Ralstonia solanacearum]UZF28006.1 hypothetical protein LGV80_20755 [Ralstonia sp. RS642]UZF33163.1 hypothetical protein LGV82_21225 [Ralstonia sp. RS650]